jgi:hypothetical protein
LGLASYYRKFVKHFGVISRPFTELLKKESVFIWTSDQDIAFHTLKSALMQAPVLALPNFSKSFLIETDASDYRVGDVLMQDHQPIAFVSKSLGPKLRGLSTYENEYIAILMAIDQWRAYLHFQEFVIATDQRSLAHLNEQCLRTQWQQKVFSKLLGLQYKIIYKKGDENHVADALTRKLDSPVLTDVSESCYAISACQPQWLQAVVDGYDQDQFSKDMVAKLMVDGAADPYFSLVNGVLRFKSKIWIGNNVDLQQQLLAAYHSLAVGGHSGVPVTYRRLEKIFAWKDMKMAVHDFVKSCLTCQQAKPDKAKSSGLLQPVSVPQQAWHAITMDFVEGLPPTAQANCILVVVDKFTNYSHFIALKHPFTAAGVAKVFLENIYKLHGMPTVIISDRDKIFTSNLWKDLFALAKVNLSLNSTYHPQLDDQSERVNQCVETYLRCFVSSVPKQWISWLHLAEFWYNTSLHSSIGMSPFEALYGYHPRHFGLYTENSAVSGSVSQWLLDRKLISDLVKQHLNRATVKMKNQTNKGRSERSFQVGEWVFLKLQPYI